MAKMEIIADHILLNYISRVQAKTSVTQRFFFF